MMATYKIVPHPTVSTPFLRQVAIGALLARV